MSSTFDYEHLVTLEDTNLVGNVYFVNHLRWQGQCRERFLHEHAPGVLDALEAGLALVTIRCSCEYFAELFPFDRVRLRMSLRGAHHNRVLMHFEYVRGPELVARGEQEVAVMARTESGLQPAPVPPELQDALSVYSASTVQGG